jgi:hypothetical protein
MRNICLIKILFLLQILFIIFEQVLLVGDNNNKRKRDDTPFINKTGKIFKYF